MIKRVLATNIIGANKLYNISLHKLKATSSQSYCKGCTNLDDITTHLSCRLLDSYHGEHV